MSAELMYRSEADNAKVVYSRSDMGSRYKVYRKTLVEQLDGSGYLPIWEYVIAFPGPLEAVNYARKMSMLPIYRPIEAPEEMTA